MDVVPRLPRKHGETFVAAPHAFQVASPALQQSHVRGQQRAHHKHHLCGRGGRLRKKKKLSYIKKEFRQIPFI